jgi:protein-L-isoaspartate(D-aspartate) O-methyltransferase
VTDQNFSLMRAAMVASQLRTNAITDPVLIEAFAEVPRHRFVSSTRAPNSYIDVPVPLSEGRALNAPLTTARLLMESRIRPGEKVLLIGAATGYCAAILARLGASVVAVEEAAELVKLAPADVSANAAVRFVVGPLSEGHAAGAPYDVIIVDGAIETVPPALVDQCADHGRLVTSMIERGVSRLSIGYKSRGGIALKPFFDCQSVILPGFAKAREFVF